MKRIIRIGKWLLLSLLALHAVAAIVGFLYQSLSQSSDLQRWPAPGRLVEVDGALMHIYCQGTGSPTAILEQGTGSYYSHWGDLVGQLAAETRVCAYDRAGMGYSESLDRPLRSDEVAARLHGLLQNAGITDNIILIGWSLGGIHVRHYYKQFPEDVAGMILLDSSHEQQQQRFGDAAAPRGFDTRRIGAALAGLGVIRISGQMDAALDAAPGTAEHKARSKAVQLQTHWLRAYLNEFEAFRSDQALNSAPPSLRDLPLIVLTRGRAVPDSEQQREAVWQQMQNELVQLSTRRQQVIAHESGHSIHLDQPQLVLDALRQMLLITR